MQISLYNDTGVKVFATVNGIQYIIQPQSVSVARCTSGVPVQITLSQKLKSFVLINPFGMNDWLFTFQSPAYLILDPTYVLHLEGDEHHFRINSESFDCEKYYSYDRLYIDDPIVKNNCTYEVTRLKKVEKRVKFFNYYTFLVAAAVIFCIMTFVDVIRLAVTGVDEIDLTIILGAVVFGIWGAWGKRRIRNALKKVTDQSYIQACFRGLVEQTKHDW